MKSHKIFILTLFLGLLCNYTYGQTLSIKKIDNICKSIDNNTELVERISEGEFTDKKGGWETYFLIDGNDGTINRVKQNSSTDLYYSTLYYYKNKKVIKVIQTIKETGPSKTAKLIYTVTYYFDNNKLIKSVGENNKYSNSIDILEQAKLFQVKK